MNADEFMGLAPWVYMDCCGSSNLNLIYMMLKIEFKKVKVANGLIVNTKGYHTQFCLLLAHPLRKFMTLYDWAKPPRKPIPRLMVPERALGKIQGVLDPYKTNYD
jgi:hypothetical protein